MSNFTDEDVTIDARSVNLMRLRILKLERDNEKDKKLSDNDMIKQIMKIIEEEAKCL